VTDILNITLQVAIKDPSLEIKFQEYYAHTDVLHIPTNCASSVYNLLSTRTVSIQTFVFSETHKIMHTPLFMKYLE
jgi:hypothetical protein